MREGFFVNYFLNSYEFCDHLMNFNHVYEFCDHLREPFKSYLADFFRFGGDGGTPQILLKKWQKLFVKGAGTPNFH